MPLLSPEFDQYLPHVDDSGDVVEERAAHRLRVAPLLPNFPNDVLGQWIYEHWIDVNRFDWLDFKTLSFQSQMWTTDEVVQCGAAAHPYVELYRKYFEDGENDRRVRRISDYMLKHGTWPVRPLLLMNQYGSLHWPGGGEFCRPFHPIEGQHRLGVFMSLAACGQLVSQHEVWCVNAPGAAQLFAASDGFAAR